MENLFLTNYTDITFLDHIKDCLRRCTSFAFSVSFIKKAGLVLLQNDIKAALDRGCSGRIITSTYQNFTDIESLKTLFTFMDYSNFSCHLDFDSFHDDSYATIGYHSKGYLFEYEHSVECIVGSSNITRYALLKNIEWDVSIKDMNVYRSALIEFDDKWNQTEELSNELITKYSMKLNYAIERWDMDYDLSNVLIQPNFMQKRALKELNRYRAMGVSRALVVAAAGSGKSYLSAFDARNFNPKKLLYIVHEFSIMKKTMETFQMVFGNDVSYGLYNAESKEITADFLFAGNGIMSANLEAFSPDEFDYIIVDECHHATAQTYKKIINYFKPEFLLGLTATPERMDNQDVFELFDQNVPYELRLRDAIINDLVVPFKYYGIRDQLIDYGLNKAQERKLVAQLATVEHCDYISEQIEKYRQPGKLKALAFCRSIQHARMMAETMGERYKTAYLTGSNKLGERIRAYNDLQSDEKDLEILFTVDILNEGVDIPGVNMVLFLRPTESSTVFIQQLGRGLRKYTNKKYVTVLDFIGNSYKRSVQIAFALGSLSNNLVMEKRLLHDLVKDDFSALELGAYGVEINIDDLSKEEIIEYIEKENFNSVNYLKQDFFNFKKYINCSTYPKHMDYWNNDCAPDLIRFMNIKINNRKTNSYYNFLKGMNEENIPYFNDDQIGFINYLSEMLPLVRPYEFLVFEALIHGEKDIEAYTRNNISSFNEESYKHAIRFMIENKYLNPDLTLNVELSNELIEYVDDLLTYGITRYNAEYKDCDEDFILYHTYRVDQVHLKINDNPGNIMKGTHIEDGIVYIFAGLKKDAKLEEHLKYNDRFIEPGIFQWECEAGLNQEKQNELIYSKEAVVFVRKVKTENGITLPFTYVGKGKLTNPRQTDNVKGSLLFDIILENELPDYLQYDLIPKDY